MSRILSEQTNTHYKVWELPKVEGTSINADKGGEEKKNGPLTAEEIEKIQAQAYQEAYDAGFIKGQRDGLAAGAGEVGEKLQLLNALIQSLAKPLHEMDEVVVEEMVSLSIAIARQLVRRELKANPGEVIGVVHEALASLPVASRSIRVRLHPEDLPLVNEAVGQPEGERNWVLEEDPALNRGDCVIHTDISRVDASVERRLAAVVAQLFGGERKQDAPADGTPPADA